MDQKTPGIIIHIELELPPDRLEDFLLMRNELYEVVQKEPGFIRYDLNNLASNPNKFILYEEWASKEDLDRHLKSEKVLKLINPYFSVFVPGSWKLNAYEVQGRIIPNL